LCVGWWTDSSDIPNAIAAVVTCFVALKRIGVDYRNMVLALDLTQKTKKGGIAKK